MALEAIFRAGTSEKTHPLATVMSICFGGTLIVVHTIFALRLSPSCTISAK